MPRPTEDRYVQQLPPCQRFKPAGIPTATLREVVLTVDQYEAIRLVDLEGMYQEQAAEVLGVSRQTVGRILETARRTVAEMLVHGKSLRIEGGAYVTGGLRRFQCTGCSHVWELPFGGGRPGGCPRCGGAELRRTDPARGKGRGRGRRRGNA